MKFNDSFLLTDAAYFDSLKNKSFWIWSQWDIVADDFLLNSQDGKYALDTTYVTRRMNALFALV